LSTQVGKSVCKAPLVPPVMFDESPMILAMYCSAFVTDGSVHLIWCAESWSYFAAPHIRK
jgi:hypothetical protein